MKITRYILDEILSVLPSHPPEAGGIIGGIDGVVRYHYFDEGLETVKACSYAPNTVLLNDVVNDWLLNGITFMGIYHSHFNNVTTLSEGDEQYITTIMVSMPNSINHLYFPLITLPNREMFCYLALRKSDGIEIIKDDLILI